jgi:hypothetical protein
MAPPAGAHGWLRATLWVGAVWVIVSTAALLTIPGIRALRRRDAAEALRSAPAAG